MLPAALRAQQDDLLFKHLSIEQGLSQSIVGAMLQDRQGFMWLVTEDGLNRFDGYGFKVFKHDAKDPSTLIHNEIKCIREDRDDILWVGSFYRGLERFDPSTERFTHFQSDPANPGSLSNDIVWAVLEDRAGRLWVGTGGGGLNLFDRSKGTFKHYVHDPANPSSLSHDDVRVIYEDATGAIWIGTAGGGLNRLDPATGTFTRYLNDNDIRSILQDKDGSLWVGTAGGGLNCLEPATGEFLRFRNDPNDPRSLGNDTVLALLLDGTGTLWVGTDGGGLNRFNREKRTFVRYTHSRDQPGSLAGNRVYSLCMDRSGVLWVGTYGSGVSRCDLNKKQFLHYASDPNDPTSLSHDIVWSFWEEPAGVLWVGTNDGGLNRLDRASGRFTRYLHDPADPRSLSHNSVRMVIADIAGTLWLATNGGGLDRFDPKTGVFRHYRNDPSDPGSLSSDQLRMVFEDREGKLWVGTYGGGLDRWNPGTDRFDHFRSDPVDAKTISNNYVRTAFEDSAGVLWFGTHGGGLNRYDRASGTFTRYRSNPMDPTTLSSDFVFSIHEDRSGTLWVATYGGGLDRYDRKTGTFTAFRKSNGLPDDAIYGIIEDSAGNLWLSTNSGIARFDPRTGVSRNYTMADGLQSNEFNGGAYYKNSRGEMFFGGINGFNVFDPARIKDKIYKAPIVLTDFRLFHHTVPIGKLPDGRTLLSRSISSTPQIEISHRDQVVSFEFAALDFASPEKNRYAYKLEGLNRDWIDYGNRRTVMFTTLPAGHYVLRVRGTNSDGVWNEEGTSLRLIVRPPWWRTVWAYLSYVLLLVGVMARIVLFVKAREREKGWLVEAELKAQAAELQSRTMEAEARTLKVENDRKSQELEEARKLQLSMLPARLPQHPDYVLAARMRTATEVGGDYYDFHIGEDRALTVALGDATGHGTRAGIMVAIMKTLFSRLCTEPDLKVFFRECDRTIRDIGMEQMYMALGILRIKGQEGRAVCAAAPPLFIYRAASGAVEQITLQGMFLGTDFDLPYGEACFTLATGDKILLLSDGYEEQFNASEEQLGYERCGTYFAEAGGLQPEEIISHLFRRFDDWRGKIHQGDDVTIVVVECKGKYRAIE